ncbi:hypothetical protein BDZ89DRAFT_972043, partial [Hymenopellis radicata]
LDLAQLADVKKQLDEELTHLTSSFAQLKAAQAKFKSCIDSVRQLRGAGQSNPVLVPLRNSLYVPRKITDADSVIVDVGTGYYATNRHSQDRLERDDSYRLHSRGCRRRCNS